MAKGQRIVGLELTPETNLARRFIEKNSLAPPVDIRSMVEAYARLTFTRIPFDGVDGVSLNLKTRDKSPHVIVNSSSSPSRQRFTMAHELGHILIPWHIGSVLIDQVAPVSSHRSNYFTSHSWSMETEANSFAAELLMPHSWIMEVLSTTDDLSKVHRSISQTCKTSAFSAAIRLSQFLPERIVYASERDGVVEFSGRTDQTIANPLKTGTDFPIEPFAYSDHHYVSQMRERRLHWWRLPVEIRVDSSDDRTWRDILDCILHDIGLSTQESIEMKMSISGIIGSANNVCKGKRNVDSVVSACIQRLSDRHCYREIAAHRDFYTFVRKRAEDIVDRSSR